MTSEVIRAVRGWALGNPFGRGELEETPSLKCPCTYTKPYLHSLVMREVHWPGPIAQLPENLQNPLHKKDFWSKHLPGFGQYSVTRVSVSNPYVVHVAGFYSYQPAHIERMGQWSECDVLGVVTLFGDIVVHERGYRSSGLRIDKLWVLDSESYRRPPQRVQSFLEETYRCDVVILRRGSMEGFVDWVEKEEVRSLL